MQASYPSRATYTELLSVFGRELPKAIVDDFQLHKQVACMLYMHPKLIPNPDPAVAFTRTPAMTQA